VQKDQHAAQAKKNHANVAPAVKAVSLRIDIVAGHKSWLVVRRLSNPKKIVYQNTLTAPAHIGGTVQHDPKGYLISSACNPTVLTLTVNGKMFALGSGGGPWKVTANGVVATRAPAGIPSGC
jgi:hypothetical protein